MLAIYPVYFYSQANRAHLDLSISQLETAKEHDLMEISEDE